MVEDLRLNSNLLGVPAFVGARSVEEVQRAYGLKEVVKLASNENPLGPSPLALKALDEVARDFNRYDTPYYDRLCEKLARITDPELGKGNFIIGNGSFEVLRMIAMGFLQSGTEAIMCRTTWHGYKILTKMQGAECVLAEPDGFRNDLGRMADQITERTQLVFICNPNNPTGTVITQSQLDEFMERVPSHVVVVLDEAYRDFADACTCADALGYLKRGRNVIITHTFSKLYGLASLRIGYGIARREIIEYLDRTNLPYHVPSLSLVAAEASLDDKDHIQRCTQLNAAEKRYLYSKFDELDVSYVPTQANFVLLTNVKHDAKAICEAMLRRGVIVRPMGTFGIPDGIRVTIGLREENQRLVHALGEVLKELGECKS